MLRQRFTAVLPALLLCSAAVSAQAAAGPQTVKLLPPEAVSLAGFELHALRGTSLFDRLLAKIPMLGQTGALGFDPRQDLDRVFLATAGPLDGLRGGNALVILEGRFSRVESMLRALPSQAEHAGVGLRQIRFDDGAASSWFAALLDEQTAVAGPEALVLAAIDRWRAPERPSKASAVALAQRDAHVWAATLDPAAAIDPWIDNIPGGGGPFRAIAAGMQSLAIRGFARGGSVQAQLAFLCRDSGDARSLADAAQAVTAFGALTAQRDRPDLAKVLGTVRIDQADAEMTVSVDLTEQQFLNLR